MVAMLVANSRLILLLLLENLVTIWGINNQSITGLSGKDDIKHAENLTG